MTSSRTRARGLALTAGLAALLFASPGWSQDDEKKGPEPLNGTAIGEDDEIGESFERFEQRHKPRGEWSRLADFYQKRIDHAEQGLFGLDGERYVPMYIFCHQRVALLPPIGLAAYRRSVDAEATRLFDEARKTSKVEPLEELIRRYYCSSPGDDALLLAGAFYMERGRFHEALSVLRQLHSSLGQSVLHYPDTAIDLEGVKARMAYCMAALGDRGDLEALLDSWDPANYWGAKRGEAFVASLTKLADSAAPSEAKNVDWPTVYGNAQHTNSTGFEEKIAAPRMWQTQVLRRAPLFSGNFGRTFKNLALPPNQVVVKGNRIYRIKRDGVEALSIYNGMQEWQAPIDTGVDVGNSRNSFYQQLPTSQTLRNWRLRGDPAAASISIAGKWLFTIQRTIPPGLTKNNWRPNWQGNNVLRVYDTTRDYEGLAGIPTFGGKDEKREAFKGVYWLAAPIASGGRLYLPAQQEGEYKIFCFDQKSLRLLWRTMIAGVSQDNQGRRNYYDLNRRAPVGALVTAGNGKIFWASQNGAVACLDAVRGEKVWVTRYWSRRHKFEMPSWRQESASDWHLTPPILVGGRLIVAARDSHEICCYNAATGKVIWKASQLDMRGIAGVRGNSIYLYNDHVREVDLVGGKMIRDSKRFTMGKASGHPVLGAKEMYFPTANGLLVIDLDTLEPTRQHDMASLFPPDPASGDRSAVPALGNLVLCRDVLISAHWQGISVFYSANLKKRLLDEASAAIAAKPEDFRARHYRAGLYQDFDQYDKALDDAEAAHALAKRKRHRYKAELTIKNLTYHLYQRTRDSKHLIRGLKWVKLPPRARLSLAYTLAVDHIEHKRHIEALRLLLELQRTHGKRPDIIVELEGGRGVRLDLLLEQRLPALRREVPADPKIRAALVAKVAKLEGPAGIKSLLAAANFDPATAELELIYAIHLENLGRKTENEALSRYRKLIRTHAKTPAALGALFRLVGFYQKEELTGRSLRYMAQIDADYGDVAVPPADLQSWIARWSPKKKGTDAPPKDGDDDGAADGEEKGARTWKPATGKQLLAMLRAPRKVLVPAVNAMTAPIFVLPFSGRPLPALVRTRIKRAGWPLSISRAHTLTRSKTSPMNPEPVDYARAQVIGEVPSMNAIVIWVGEADKRQIELRDINDFERPMWRSVQVDHGGTVTTSTRRYYGYHQRGKLLRKMPGPVALNTGARLIVLDRFRVQAFHCEEGRLKWERDLKVDKPHGMAAPNPRRPMLDAPPTPILKLTEDRAFVLTPGGVIYGFEIATGEIAWSTKRTPIPQHREGRMYVIDDQLLVLARVGGEGKAGKTVLARWDEIGGRTMGSTAVEGPLVDLPDRLASGGTLVLATAQVVRGVDPITLRDRWKMEIEGIKTLDVLPDGNVVVGSSGAFHLLDGSSGRTLVHGQMGEAGEMVCQAKTVGDYLYVLGQPGRERNSHQVDLWVGAFRISQRKRIWGADLKSAYYPYYHHLLGMEGGACVVSSYSMQANRSSSQIFKDGKVQRSINVGSQNRNRMTGPLSARKPHAYNGFLFIPGTSGIETYSKGKK